MINCQQIQDLSKLLANLDRISVADLRDFLSTKKYHCQGCNDPACNGSEVTPNDLVVVMREVGFVKVSMIRDSKGKICRGFKRSKTSL